MARTHVLMASNPDQHNEACLQVHANFEKACSIRPGWIFSDSGADTCVLGCHAGNIRESGQFADLVGYDPESTKTPHVPIVSGMIKVKVAQTNVPVILEIHQAAYLGNVSMALMSEYQVHNSGLILDSTSSHHVGIDGNLATQ